MIRVGLGYDIHRLVEGRKLLLGGVELAFDKGEDGHSDGDVLFHAITDAILGAGGLGDIESRVCAAIELVVVYGIIRVEGNADGGCDMPVA